MIQGTTPKISVVIPTYNMARTIGETLRSVLNQTYKNFEIIVQDNGSADNTTQVIDSFKDRRIRRYRNKKNIGYAKNLFTGVKKAKGEIVYLLAADDILSKFALSRAFNVFKNQKIGAITRPYYWFQEQIGTPIRVTPVLNGSSDELIYIKDIKKSLFVLHNEILGQLSGLAFRKKLLEPIFFTKDNDWIAHGYPFVCIFKHHPVVFLKDYQVAIRVGENMIRQKGSNLYDVSPTSRWIEMLNALLPEKKFSSLKNHYIKNVLGKNFIGLIQIRSYSRLSYYIREALLLVRLDWKNLANITFWFFFLGCLITPPSILVKMVDFYKNSVNKRILSNIRFTYDIS